MYRIKTWKISHLVTIKTDVWITICLHFVSNENEEQKNENNANEKHVIKAINENIKHEQFHAFVCSVEKDLKAYILRYI